MAINTARKRASAVNLSLPFGRLLPIPDGSFDEADRETLAELFGELAGEELLETRTQRHSMINVALPFGRILPTPDTEITVGDRSDFVYRVNNTPPPPRN